MQKNITYEEYRRLLAQEYIPPRKKKSHVEELSDVDKLVNYAEFVSFYFLSFPGARIAKHPLYNILDYSGVLSDSYKNVANYGLSERVHGSILYKTLMKGREDGLKKNYNVLLGGDEQGRPHQDAPRKTHDITSMSDPNRDAYIGSVKGGVYSSPVNRGSWRWKSKGGLSYAKLHVAFEEYLSSLPKAMQDWIVITSTTGGNHASRSYHYVSMAIDISCRGTEADEYVLAIFSDPLLSRFGLWTLDPNHGTSPHIHLEYRGSRNEFGSYTLPSSKVSSGESGGVSQAVLNRLRGAQHGLRTRSTLRDDILKDSSFNRSGVDGATDYGSGSYNPSGKLDDGSRGRTTYNSVNPWSGAKLVAKPLTKKKGNEENALSFFGKQVGSDAPPSLYVLSEHEIVLDAMSIDGDNASYEEKKEKIS